MKMKIIAAGFIVAIALVGPARAQIYDTNNAVVQTFAGFGIPGYVDGQGQLSAFSNPSQIVADTASNLYVWDGSNFRIRKITPAGTVSTLAGGGTLLEGSGTNVSFTWGSSGAFAIDHANTLWLVMNGYNLSFLLSISTNGYVSLANGGMTNLTTTSGICFDSANNLYYTGGNRIYRCNPTSGLTQPIAGSGIALSFDGPGTLFSAFNYPTWLAADQADNLYVWDSNSQLIRRVDANQNVTTIAGGSYNYNGGLDGVGTNANFSGGVNSLFTDNFGNLYLICGSSIRKMDAHTNVTTLAGIFSYYGSGSYANGPGSLARFNAASGGCFAQGMVFVADSGNNRIRNITFNVSTQTNLPADLQLATYPGLKISGTVGRTYQIQSSPDVKTWSTIATQLLTASPYLWIDQNPVSGNKFYRAVLLQ